MSISVNGRAWLQNAAHARVLHLFDETCNLISDEAGVLSIVSQQVGDGPFSLVLPRLHLPDYISTTAAIECDADGLRIGGLEIDAKAAHVWDPRPDWPSIRAARKRLIASLPELITTLDQSAPRDSLAVLVNALPAPTSPLATRFQRQSREAADKLAAGLHKGDPNLSREGAAGLVGLGSGLTPAGDDWIVGCLLGSWALWEDDKARMLAGAVEGAVSERTTELSKAMIQAASHGECGALWHDLLEALPGGDAALIRSIAERIIARGHTSGADALAGFVAMMQGGVINRN